MDEEGDACNISVHTGHQLALDYQVHNWDMQQWKNCIAATQASHWQPSTRII